MLGEYKLLLQYQRVLLSLGSTLASAAEELASLVPYEAHLHVLVIDE